MNKTIALILSSIIVAFGYTATVQAQSFYPVALEYVAPDSIVAGSPVTTTLRLMIKADIKSLQVSANADTGLSLLSGSESREFTDLRSGETREVEVTFQLDGQDGYLVVSTTATGLVGGEKVKVRAIRFSAESAGTTTNTTNMRSAKLPNDSGSSTGERLYFMPLEAR